MTAMPATESLLLRDARTAVLRLFPGVEAVYAFGSQVDGRARADSDLDLAVLGAAPLAPAARIEAQRELSVILGIDVDLVDLHKAGAVLRMEVVTRGRLLFRSAADSVLDFEARVLGEYADLMDATRELHADVRERGRVYAR